MAVFDTVVLSEGFFGANKVNCAAPVQSGSFLGSVLTATGDGRPIVYGTDDGVYIADLQEPDKDPVKVLALVDVGQVDVLEDFQLLIVLSEREVLAFPLDALDPTDPTAGLKHLARISSDVSFFKTGRCLDRVLVSIIKSTRLSTVVKILEPPGQTTRGHAPIFKKQLQGGNAPLKPFREFYMPVESTSIHYLKTRLCIGCSKGFEIVDLESLETHGLLDPADKSINAILKTNPLLGFLTPARVPMALYRIDSDFLICYDKFAFYVNKSGNRSRSEFMVTWKDKPTGFALHRPYVLAFSPSSVEIRHIETGLVSQTILGSNMRLLFADPPSGNDGPVHVPGKILMVSEDRIFAVRLAAGSDS
ncbi:CNH domain-containing protein [Mycena capillaripes]|nr:CNH domain-containing protein [Mycena capillaripes]